MFVRFNDVAVRALVKGDRRLGMFAKLVGNEGLREALEHRRVSWNVEWVRDEEGVLAAKE
jgi:hypothetical protein